LTIYFIKIIIKVKKKSNIYLNYIIFHNFIFLNKTNG
jgi:hypothetical protein